ncbi:MAG: leucyl aminopeptidase family protein [Saprospiraceae bacterium]|nr:leucyl aminopeptidase family protein [Saprospiraceae bacterium]
MKITLINLLQNLDNRSIVIPFIKNDQLDEQIATALRSWNVDVTCSSQDFKAETKEICTLFLNEKKIYLLGIGSESTFSNYLNAFRFFSFKYGERIQNSLVIDTQYIDFESSISESIFNGLVLGAYQLGLYKTDEKKKNVFTSQSDIDIQVLTKAPSTQFSDLQKAALEGVDVADTQLRIYDMVNAPGNIMTSESMAQWARDSAEKYNFTVKLLNKEQLDKEGLNALLAVNRGSEYPAFLIIGEYQHPDWKVGMPHISLVGKGVTFDTGGVSIKESTNMHFMKSDMAGAAAALGAIEAAAKLKLPIKVNCVVAATDNLVDRYSMKPGDVITAYNGKTIEIIDTDAEGRLVLADALAYTVKNHHPNIVIDLATLTGSCVATFGYHAGGLFSNNDSLAADLEAVGTKSGERIWRLPIWDLYKEDLKSDVADVRNYSGRPVAGAITAAKFLEVFIEGHSAWAHLDIAGMSFAASEYCSQRCATAFGVRLLIEYMKLQSK